MKVTGPTSQAINQAAKPAAAKTDQVLETKIGHGPKTSEAAKPDVVVDLSNTKKDMALAREVMNQAPAVRQERVAALKEQMKNGTFRVDPEAIADKMVKELIDKS